MKKGNTFMTDLLLLLVAVIWGGGFIAGKLALSGLSPIAVLLYRFFLAAVIVGVIFFRKIKNAVKKEILYGCLLGTLMFLGLMIQLAALQYTTVANQSFIASAYVVFTPLLTWILFRNRPSAKEMFAAALVLTGVAFISLGQGTQIRPGDFLTLGFTLIFALQIIIIGRYTKELSAINLTFFQLVTAFVLSAAAVVIFRIPMEIQSPVCAAGILYLAAINTAAAMLLQNYAQKRTTENRAALLLSLESVFGFLFAVLIFHDPVTAKMLFGCVMILAGVILAKMDTDIKVIRKVLTDFVKK